LKELFDISVLEEKLVFLQDGLYLDYDIELEMQQIIIDTMTPGKGLTVAEIRDLLKTSRKYAVPFCEHLDKIGVTRRDGDLRYLAKTKENDQK